jgi:hypothetical protein
LQARKQYDEADRVLASAANRRKGLASQSSPDRIDLNAAGVLATARKNYREAEQLLLRSLAILESAQSRRTPIQGRFC